LVSGFTSLVESLYSYKLLNTLSTLTSLELGHGVVAKLQHLRRVFMVERAAELRHSFLAWLLLLVRRAGGARSEEETKQKACLKQTTKLNVFFIGKRLYYKKEGVSALL
jgi:hypothetical protein